jgi:hypothetical protein
MQKADQMQKKMSHHYIIDACNWAWYLLCFGGGNNTQIDFRTSCKNTWLKQLWADESCLNRWESRLPPGKLPSRGLGM